MRVPIIVAVTLAITLTACEAPDWKMEGAREPDAPVVAGPIDPTAKAGAAQASPGGAGDPGVRALEPVGAPANLTTDGDENLQWAASVVQLVPIEDQSAKVFATAGGDPAVNGLYTYVAFFAGPADGWQVYRLGDFRTFDVRAITPGRIDLNITEDAASPTTGDIVQTTRRAIVRWTPGRNGAPPTRVMLTAAR